MNGEERNREERKMTKRESGQEESRLREKMGTRTRRVRNQSSVKHTLSFLFLFFHSLFLMKKGKNGKEKE